MEVAEERPTMEQAREAFGTIKNHVEDKTMDVKAIGHAWFTLAIFLQEHASDLGPLRERWIDQVLKSRLPEAQLDGEVDAIHKDIVSLANLSQEERKSCILKIGTSNVTRILFEYSQEGGLTAQLVRSAPKRIQDRFTQLFK